MRHLLPLHQPQQCLLLQPLQQALQVPMPLSPIHNSPDRPYRHPIQRHYHNILIIHRHRLSHTGPATALRVMSVNRTMNRGIVETTTLAGDHHHSLVKWPQSNTGRIVFGGGGMMRSVAVVGLPFILMLVEEREKSLVGEIHTTASWCLLIIYLEALYSEQLWLYFCHGLLCYGHCILHTL